MYPFQVSIGCLRRERACTAAAVVDQAAPRRDIKRHVKDMSSVTRQRYQAAPAETHGSQYRRSPPAGSPSSNIAIPHLSSSCSAVAARSRFQPAARSNPGSSAASSTHRALERSFIRDRSIIEYPVHNEGPHQSTPCTPRGSTPVSLHAHHAYTSGASDLPRQNTSVLLCISLTTTFLFGL